ncbi:hypothetical protein [uncultured Massilia sp.]|uniref:hypothetical protein n=1 Tax=uncultured Massilia sp. TaxID=169973 RepID=UPI0025831DAE|nr:hypothetical protein [uncultured Massilia sp.]
MHTVLRLRGVRMAVVLVEAGELHDDQLIVRLQMQLALPVMLVARDDVILQRAKARAQFDAEPYLFALLALDEIEWSELPAITEPELPF